jgi:hypothetical protein
LKKNAKKIYEKQKKQMIEKRKEFVKIPTPSGKMELVYANGVAEEIQKNIPKLMEKKMKEMLK